MLSFQRNSLILPHVTQHLTTMKKIPHNPPNTLESQFSEIINYIAEAREHVFTITNTVLINLYWRIGERLSHRIASADWGEGIVKQLANYISQNIPDAKGFSDKNLWRMKQFYDTYSDSCDEKLSALLRQISWTNNLYIMSRCKTSEEREFYIRLSVSERLSSRELNRQINSGLFERCMLDKPKLSATLRDIVPSAEKTFRDRYVLEFLGGKNYSDEHSMKQTLIQEMKNFLLEIGKDFIFMGQEYRLQVGNEDFRIDLLFFHRELRCLVAFEIKMGRFHPANLGQLEFYLEALDRDIKKPHENPSIGILLCKDKDDEVVEYAMARSLSPTMVAEYQINLPDKKLLRNKMKELFEETLPDWEQPE